MLPYRLNDSIVLKLLQEHHAAGMFALIGQNRAYLREWLGWLDKTNEVADSQKFIRDLLTTFVETGAFVCGIWHDSALCGLVGYNGIDWENRSANLGYWLAENFQGRGIITQCCRVLIDHAFINLDLQRIEIHIALGNDRSQALADRLGFVRDGILQNAEWLYDHNVDHTINVLHRPPP